MINLWICAYGLIYILAELLVQAKKFSPWFLPLTMFGYTCALLLWIFRRGKSRSVGLCAIRKMPAKSYWQLLPLLLFPLYNIMTRRYLEGNLADALLMFSICTVEEIFFRGFLLHYFKKHGAFSAVLFSSILFALFHLANFVNGNPLLYTLMQFLSAFSVALCYGAATLHFRSLIPGLLAHFLTNMTAGEANDLTQMHWGFLWFCIVASCFFGIYFSKYLNIHNKENQVS